MASATLNIYQAVEFTVGTQTTVVGSKVTPVQFTYSNSLVCQRTCVIAPTTKYVLLTAVGAGSDINTLDGFVISSDLAIYVQLESSSAANNSTISLAAGQTLICTDGSIVTYDAAGNFGSTALVDITTIRGYNPSAASSATVRVWAFG